MGYTAVPLQLEEHRSELVRLWTESLEGHDRIAGVVDARMRWFYDEGPYGPPRTWLTVQSPGDGVVGCGSFYPRDTFVRGRRVKAAILAEFGVHKDHRVAGAAVTVQRAVATNSTPLGVELLYGYPNKAGIQVFQRVGHKVVGEVSHWAKPLRAAYKLREFVHSPLVARAAGAVVDALFWAEDAPRLLDRPLALGTEIVRRADDRFDDLWRRTLPPRYVVGERSAAYLNWRYADFKTADYRFFCLTERRTRRLLGYVAYTIDGKKVTVADLYCDDLERTTAPLLLRFALRMRVAGMDFISLSYVGNAFFERQLESMNFMKASGSRPLVVYAKGVPKDLEEEIMNPQNWFMIDGELDI